MVWSNGYPLERHRIEVEDGFILELHRIPHGKSKGNSSSEEDIGNIKRPVVFLVHCILCTSSIWVMQGPKRGLAYALADGGYDVWMLNVRGNSYSNRHAKYSSKEKAFWNFSFHESGIYDAPQSIDYILNVTHQSRVYYIGYSMGTTIFFVMTSMKPEYNDKIIKAIAIAPAVYLKNAKGYILHLSKHCNFIEAFLKDSNIWYIPSGRWDVKGILQDICDYSDYILRPVCSFWLYFLAGIKTKDIMWEKMNYFFNFFPDFNSLNTVLHFFQGKNADIFCQYDHGSEENMKMYGSHSPPRYNLSLIDTPVHLLYSMGDTFVPSEGVHRLKSELPNTFSYEINISSFSHAHFAWGKEATKIVNERIMQILKD